LVMARAPAPSDPLVPFLVGVTVCWLVSRAGPPGQRSTVAFCFGHLGSLW